MQCLCATASDRNIHINQIPMTQAIHHVRKVITSGFSFSGSSAIHDLLIDHGATAFPGGEMRIFSSRHSFSAVISEIRRKGKASTRTIDRTVGLLRGNAPGPNSHFTQSVTVCVRRIRKAFGDYYDLRVDRLHGELCRARDDDALALESCQQFVDELCSTLSTQTGASTIVFDQGVRPWALNPLMFYTNATTLVCRRDVRDQIIERSRHSLDNSGFQLRMRTQSEKFLDSLQSLETADRVITVWFEDVITNLLERRRILALVGLDATARSGNAFNPIASRRNIGLYRLRPDLAPTVSNEDAPLLYKNAGWSRRAQTFILDYLHYGASARSNAAGAYTKTKRLEDVSSPSPP